MDATVTQLLERARSDAWSDRAAAGRDLAPRCDDDAEIRSTLLGLLLDEDNTAVSESTAAALLAHGSRVAWRLFAQAWTRADTHQRDHLYGTFVNASADAAVRGRPAEDALHAHLVALAEDDDPDVRSAARELRGDADR